jgi:DNA-directed RNA polymerase subunit RPC12/RpoP
MDNMLTMAKQIIDKGNLLNDPELVSMGMDMLTKYSIELYLPAHHIKEDGYDDNGNVLIRGEQSNAVIVDDVFEPLPTIPEKYVCSNCSYTFAVDKEGRKKCPECKKHSLVIISTHTSLGLDTFQPKRNETAGQIVPRGRATADDFLVQIREKKKSRIRYNEKGEEDGTYAETQQIEGVSNVWKDDGEEGQDKANELLKQVMRISPRTRKGIKLMNVVCESCKEKHSIHPIHAGGRGRYLCDRCIKRRSKI